MRLAALGLGLAACGGGASHGSFRLDGKVRPLDYTIELRIDPAKETFTGVAEIRLLLPAGTRQIWLHGVELDQLSAKLGGKAVRATPVRDERIRFDLPEPMGGEQRLVVEYRGQLSERELDGVLRRQDGGHWYAFTQFEDTLARRAFPCFDEPSYKVPLRLTLVVPRGRIVVANAALAESTEAAFAARETKVLFDRLVEFFGVPYPYAKLDQIAVPLPSPRSYGTSSGNASRMGTVSAARATITASGPSRSRVRVASMWA